MSIPKSSKDYAASYIALGFRVLPVFSANKRDDSFVCTCGNSECTSPAKHPVGKLVPQGLKNASGDRGIIKSWFGGFSQNNIGIATGAVSGIAVMDIDDRHGGRQSLKELEAKYEPLPETLRWQTGGGGEHILFRHPGGMIPNSAGALGSGIDVRGDGGYIVAPPSRHKSGNYYYLPDGYSLDTPLAPLPPWLSKLILQGRSGISDEKVPIKQIVRERVPEGQRNTTIARISGHLLAKRVDTQICLDLMQAYNAMYCVPPLDVKEVARTVASIEHLAFTKLINKK